MFTETYHQRVDLALDHFPLHYLKKTDLKMNMAYKI